MNLDYFTCKFHLWPLFEYFTQIFEVKATSNLSRFLPTGHSFKFSMTFSRLYGKWNYVQLPAPYQNKSASRWDYMKDYLLEDFGRGKAKLKSNIEFTRKFDEVLGQSFCWTCLNILSCSIASLSDNFSHKYCYFSWHNPLYISGPHISRDAFIIWDWLIFKQRIKSIFHSGKS